eukprot:3796502-Pyramimonas_sp.AAC.1
MSILSVATQPVSERSACFLGDIDFGQLGTASTTLYKVVSIALILWAMWAPDVPCGAQWVGSPMVLDGRTVRGWPLHDRGSFHRSDRPWP